MCNCSIYIFVDAFYFGVQETLCFQSLGLMLFLKKVGDGKGFV